MNFKQAVSLIVLVMFGGCVYKFGGQWDTWVWGIALVVFLAYALAVVNSELAAKFYAVLPGVMENVKSFIPFLKKKDPPTPPPPSPPNV